MRTVKITDDFDIDKIAHSGQCFRVKQLDNRVWRFIADNKILLMRSLGKGVYEVSADVKEWNGFWYDYFDLDRNYSVIRSAAKGRSAFVDEALEFGKGLRVLRQDPWEMLVTFIISQRKSIPAITSAVEALCEAFGEPIRTRLGMLYAFPLPEVLAAARDEDLAVCGLGYRLPYVRSAAEMVSSGELDLLNMSDLEDEKLFAELQRVHGVGKKVANCVCLFGYSRASMVPVDVWIARAIDEECGGVDPFADFGDDAGIIQQYVFYYMTNRKK